MAKLAFLTRGDEQWGMGHLHRVSWLVHEVTAQAGERVQCEVRCVESKAARQFWQRHTEDTPVSFHARAEDTASAPAALFVIDWLASPPELVSTILRRGAHVVLLDDNGPALGIADLAINALITPLDAREQVADGRRVLGGAAYVQLPPTVTKMRCVAQATTRAMATELSTPVPPGPVHAVLASFGGSPRPDLIALALGSLAELGFDGRVLVMPAPETPPDERGLDVEFLPAGSGFHERLAAVDIAILGGGLSLYEAAFLGVPSVVVPVDSVVPGYERHQLEAAGRLAEAGCCLNTGLASEVSSAQVAGAIATLLASAEIRGKLSTAGMQLLDGRGLMRTATAILDLLPA